MTDRQRICNCTGTLKTKVVQHVNSDKYDSMKCGEKNCWKSWYGIQKVKQPVAKSVFRCVINPNRHGLSNSTYDMGGADSAPH